MKDEKKFREADTRVFHVHELDLVALKAHLEDWLRGKGFVTEAEDVAERQGLLIKVDQEGDWRKGSRHGCEISHLAILREQQKTGGEGWARSMVGQGRKCRWKHHVTRWRVRCRSSVARGNWSLEATQHAIEDFQESYGTCRWPRQTATGVCPLLLRGLPFTHGPRCRGHHIHRLFERRTDSPKFTLLLRRREPPFGLEVAG